MAETNSNRAQKVGRLLWYDPNLANNVMVNPEDLSIMVEFTTYKKERSIIYAGERVNNTGGDSATIKFIEGSKVSESEQPSLTTRYTEAVTLEVMNGSKDNKEDFESLGIESIDIEFNTAFQPMIKIKFIDIRGQAILQQGNMSKYNIFFELPYPIFNLKVKGFYGKTVNYCLHMQRWNASFNSTTGNFEIQADFLGYTYAVLTDMLLGLIRAAVRTKKGQQKLQNKIGEYGENSDLVLTIDEMLKRLVEFNYSAKKISEDDDSASQLQSFDTIFSNIDKINSAITTLNSEITKNTTAHFNDGTYLCVPTTTRDSYESTFKVYSENVTGLINGTNPLIDVVGLKLIEGELIDSLVIIKDITKNDLNSNNIRNIIKTKAVLSKNGNPLAYSGDKSDEYITDLLETIGKLDNISLSNDAKFDIYNFKRINYKINEKKVGLEELKTKTEENLARTISDIADETLGFEPTIRNIFRVLCINTEIFLEVLKEVSSEAELNEVRKNEFIRILNNSNGLNINKKDIEAKSIYPWPEYREDKKDKNNTGFVEAWLGAAPGVNGNNINEVAFTNEMHTELLNVAKFDKDLDEEIANREAGLDVDKPANTIENPWYPISPADVPIDIRITQNPYLTALEESRTVDSVQRLLLMRGFLLIGVSVFNSKIDSGLLNLIGNFEADNFLEACRKLGPEGQNLIREYLNDGDSADAYTTRAIEMGIDGTSKLTNPNGQKNKPIMSYVGLDDNQPKKRSELEKDSNGNPILDKFYYKYNYIRNENTLSSYIPVNKNFSGVDFYNGDTFKSINELKNVSNDIIFVSSPINWRDKTTKEGSRFWKNDDGSLHVKIYENSDYIIGNTLPNFSNDLIENYLSKIVKGSDDALNIGNTIKALITEPSNPSEIIAGYQPYLGVYGSSEFSQLIYQSDISSKSIQKYMGEPQWDNNIKNDSSLLSFFTENVERDKSYPNVGSYFSKVIKNEDISYTVSNAPINGTIPAFTFKTSLELTEVDKMDKNGNEPSSNPRQIWETKGKYMKNKTLLSSNLKNNTKIYLPFIEYGTSVYKNNGSNSISLFGSWFYYSQTSNEVKALLFLHSIPWQGVKTLSDDIDEFFMLDKRSDWGLDEGNTKNTKVLSIRTLFQSYGGFIHAPKAWVLFIGAMLWRIRNQDPIIYPDKNKTFIDKKPESYQFLYLASETGALENFLNNEWFNDSSPDRNPWGMFFGNTSNGETNSESYVTIDKTIRYLPKQVRDEFITYFLNWVNADDGFKFIQKELELVNNTNKLSNAYDNLKNKKIFLGNISGNNKSYIKLSDIYENFDKSVINNYDLVIPAKDLPYNFNLILKPDTRVMNYIVSLFTTPSIIQNINPNIWNYNSFNEFNKNDEARKNGYEGNYGSSLSPSKSIRARGDKMYSFLDGFHKRLLTKKEDFLNEKILTDEDQAELEFFGTSDDKTIKLQIYRKLSAINDKWLNGSAGTSIFSQCGGGVNEAHLKVGKKFRTTATDTTLIDTFRFVDRSFTDIGDKFYIDINQVNNLIRSNYNQSFFDVANKILSDNNFNFIPLPNFVNFNDANELEQVFSAYSYNDIVNFTGTGPSFLCTYVGQTSTNLDLGENSAYPDDGLSFNLNNDGSISIPEKAEDFKEVAIIENGDMNVPVFAVNYGQQNQNYFKNVKLDQREFAETMESLEIIEDISQTGDKSKPTYAGNNLFSVYQTRSYSAEIEMMGSAMIQPMMYFQLNNIPMFRGAYLIYKVNHKITPHNMVTTFKGNRVKKPKTPLLDKATMYMNLVGTQVGGAPVSSRTPKSSQPPLIATLLENGVMYSNIDAGQISSCTVPKVSGIYYAIEDYKRKMICEAVQPLNEMLKDWIKWMKDNGFAGANGNGKIFANLTSMFRTQGEISNHSLGIAIDLNFFKKDGNMFSNQEEDMDNLKSAFSFKENPALKWFYNHAYEYGFAQPNFANDGKNVGSPDGEEWWHWEYHGTSAIYILRNRPIPAIGGNSPDDNPLSEIKESKIKDFVKNPKKPDGTMAVYTNANYIKVNKKDEGTVDVNEKEARKKMKVSNLKPGYDGELKRIITNGNYNGVNISDYLNDWVSVTANYVAKKENFRDKPKLDEGTLRAGYGTDKILVNGSLKTVTSDTVFTKQIAKDTLVYQIKNTYAKQIEKDLGSSNWNKLNKYQKAALISLGYNAGSGYIGSRDYGLEIKEAISNSDFKAAAQGILNGPITGKKSGFLPGLVSRREDEARLFLLDKNYKVTYVNE